MLLPRQTQDNLKQNASQRFKLNQISGLAHRVDSERFPRSDELSPEVHARGGELREGRVALRGVVHRGQRGGRGDVVPDERVGVRRRGPGGVLRCHPLRSGRLVVQACA
jgi:hypothetical protein